MSWVMEEVIIAFFHLRPPVYTPRKADAPALVQPVKRTK
jgi:hypothetical protein